MSKAKKQTQPKWKIRRNDQVRVISGNDKGTEGKVLEVLVKEGKIFVEGVNVIKRHTKPSAKHPDGGILKKEAPIHISNVALLDPKSGEPTRVGRRLEKDKLVRYAKKSGEAIK
ncbi:MAG: 50S ribosomal protein L24 [Bacteroidia bacterium]